MQSTKVWKWLVTCFPCDFNLVDFPLGPMLSVASMIFNLTRLWTIAKVTTTFQIKLTCQNITTPLLLFHIIFPSMNLSNNLSFFFGNHRLGIHFKSCEHGFVFKCPPSFHEWCFQDSNKSLLWFILFQVTKRVETKHFNRV